VLDAYPEGIWLVELAALADPALVPQTVAAALGVPEAPGRSRTATLVERLRSRSLLLVLDNCEHLLAACAQLAEALLRTCPDVRLLTTSRERLGLTGERVYLVPSLSLPPLVDGGWLMVDGPAKLGSPLPSTINDQPSPLLEYEAVRLFVEHAVYSQPQAKIVDPPARIIAQKRLAGVDADLDAQPVHHVRPCFLDQGPLDPKRALKCIRSAPERRHQRITLALDLVAVPPRDLLADDPVVAIQHRPKRIPELLPQLGGVLDVRKHQRDDACRRGLCHRTSPSAPCFLARGDDPLREDCPRLL
jgi:hypothetical protein